MIIKAALVDFDGTTVTQDRVDVLCELTDSRGKSEEINQAFREQRITGPQSVYDRFQLLKGLTHAQMVVKVEENLYLMPGAESLFSYPEYTTGLLTGGILVH